MLGSQRKAFRRDCWRFACGNGFWRSPCSASLGRGGVFNSFSGLICLQEEVLAGRGKAEAVVAELQRLVPLLEEAVKEETKDAVQRGLAEQAAKAEAAEPAHQAAAPPTPEREAVPAGFPTENGSVPSSEAVTEAVERLVQLAYFTQVLVHPQVALGTGSKQL